MASKSITAPTRRDKRGNISASPNKSISSSQGAATFTASRNRTSRSASAKAPCMSRIHSYPNSNTPPHVSNHSLLWNIIVLFIDSLRVSARLCPSYSSLHDQHIQLGAPISCDRLRGPVCRSAAQQTTGGADLSAYALRIDRRTNHPAGD